MPKEADVLGINFCKETPRRMAFRAGCPGRWREEYGGAMRYQ